MLYFSQVCLQHLCKVSDSRSACSLCVPVSIFEITPKYDSNDTKKRINYTKFLHAFSESWSLRVLLLQCDLFIYLKYILKCYESYVSNFLFRWFFEVGSHYIAQFGLNLTILYLSLPSTGLAGMCHHTWLMSVILHMYRKPGLINILEACIGSYVCKTQY
jgi:hypothetical protein